MVSTRTSQACHGLFALFYRCTCGLGGLLQLGYTLARVIQGFVGLQLRVAGCMITALHSAALVDLFSTHRHL